MEYHNSYLSASSADREIYKKRFDRALKKGRSFRNWLLDSNGKGSITTYHYDKKTGKWNITEETIGYDFGFYGIKNNPDGKVENYQLTTKRLSEIFYLGRVELL